MDLAKLTEKALVNSIVLADAMALANLTAMASFYLTLMMDSTDLTSMVLANVMPLTDST